MRSCAGCVVRMRVFGRRRRSCGRQRFSSPGRASGRDEIPAGRRGSRAAPCLPAVQRARRLEGRATTRGRNVGALGARARTRGKGVNPNGIRRIARDVRCSLRGNPVEEDHQDDRRGSIPACAGEPSSARASRSPTRVYPRVCGGTALETYATYRDRGLSPRVRGNRRRVRRRRRPGTTVYPRVCGGPSPRRRCGQRERWEGLSPRVRGNRADSVQ